MIKYKINPKLTIEFKDFLINIKKHFQSENHTIHKARNEIKIITHANYEYVIKSFKIPHIINKIVYSFFRDSKTKKSYENSIKISDFVPKPIGYIEFTKFGLLHESYFVSEHFNYDFTIREPLLDVQFKNREEVFKAFAIFSFKLHEKGILHQDYSPGNILIKEENDTYIFKIVDINRMEFKNLNLEERLQNFSMLWAKDEDLTCIIEAYAHLMQKEETILIQKALSYSQKHKNFKNLKKRLKGKKVVD